MPTEPITKPEFRWYYGLPLSKLWNKGARDYYTDRERYDLSFMTKSETIRYKQGKVISSTDALIFFLLTTAWTIIAQLGTDGNWLSTFAWYQNNMKNIIQLGIKGSVSWQSNWPGAMMMTIIPGGGSFLIHKTPNIIPTKGGKLAANLALKILPIVILTIGVYLILKEVRYWQYKIVENQVALQEIKARKQSKKQTKIDKKNEIKQTVLNQLANNPINNLEIPPQDTTSNEN